MKSTTNRPSFRLALLCSAVPAVLLTAGAAYGQQVPPGEVPPAEDEMAPARRDDVIVVTGSRIAQDSTLSSAGPVQAIADTEIKTSGVIDLGALLRESPQLNASLPASFSAFNGTPLGASLLDLRNLGTVRTLVLENGRRHVPAIEGTASVDVNSISTALIDRVEVLTGGASAVYGADAVTGVVNFIMREGDSFDGMEVRTQGGISGESDAEEFFISLANGFEFDDGRGSFVFGMEYQQAEPIYAGDRDFAGAGRQFMVQNNAATQAAFGVDPQYSNTWVPDLRLPISSPYGIIAISPFQSAFVEVAFFSDGTPGCRTIGTSAVPTCQVFDNGTLRPYNPGDVFIGPFDAVGGDGIAVAPDSELLLPDSQRGMFQTATRYQINEYFNFFADAKFLFSETVETNQVNGFNDDIPIAPDNAYIPAALQAQLDALAAEGIDYGVVISRDTLDEEARSNPVAERSTFRIVTGFDGELPDLGLAWEASYNFGRTDADITSRSRVEDRFFAAIDAVVDPATGEIVCRSELASTPASYVPPASPFPAQNPNFGISTFVPGDGQCVPINIFGRDTITAEAAEFIFLPTTSQNEIEQHNFLATAFGDTEPFFSLPAGPVAYAFGYEWRRETSSNEPDPLIRSGLTFGSIDSNGGPSVPSGGEIEVSELFGELEVPVISGVPMVEELVLRGAYRYSDYQTFGETDTWTLGGRWSVVDSFTIRSTLSRAVRIPNIGEAFSPQFTTFLNAGSDPCNPNFINAGSEFRFDNCVALIGSSVSDGTYNSTNFLSARVPGTSGGNPDLEPEEADTFTVGFVWRPDDEFGGRLDGLITTVDFYDIEITGLIDILDAFTIAQNCVDAPTIDNQFCAAIDRDPTFGFITGFRSGYINLAAVETQGVDFRVEYTFELSDLTGRDDLGSLRLAANGTRFLEHEETRDITDPDEVTDVLETLSRPEWITIFNADWNIGDFRFGWQGRYESDQFVPGVEKQDLENDPFFVDISRTGDSWVHDFNVSWFVKDGLEVYGGINNAFDREPYLGALSRPAGPRGRFFFIGANKTF